jgi:hypothetical protein
VANLRQYELDEEEWKVAQQLCDTLKARTGFNLSQHQKFTELSDIRGRNLILFALYTKPRNSHSSNGPH